CAHRPICIFAVDSVLVLLQPPPTPPVCPTRRSSDLLALLLLGVVTIGHHRAVGRHVTHLVDAMQRVGGGERGYRVRPAGPRELRSEEHTSELQSRENLVWRLLPEKKNERVVDAATGS